MHCESSSLKKLHDLLSICAIWWKNAELGNFLSAMFHTIPTFL